jgi:CBS domain-containing protein
MGKKIHDAMTANPCAIDADKSVQHAAKMMRDENVGFAPIVEGMRLIGALTDRDIATVVVAEGKDPETTTARDIASRNVVTVGPDEDLDAALRLMARHQVRRIPVVQQDGQLVGVVAPCRCRTRGQAEGDRRGRGRNLAALRTTPHEAGGGAGPPPVDPLRPDRTVGQQRRKQHNQNGAGDGVAHPHSGPPSRS